MRNHLLSEVRFGRAGSAGPLLKRGWSDPEDGYTFTNGAEASLAVPCALPSERGLAVELAGGSYLPPGSSHQTLTAVINGVSTGAVRFSNGTYVWLLPEAVPLGDGTLLVTFLIPTAASPSDFGGGDTRQLGIAARRLRIFALDEALRAPRVGNKDTPIPHDSELAFEFASLGDDCELGLVQRALGAEPLGLLRFSTAFLPHVQRGVETGWETLGDQLDAAVEGGEWMTRERGYDLRWHTFLAPDSITRDDLLAKERPKTALLRRKLLEDVSGGERIFVVKSRNSPAEPEQIMALHLTLNRYANNWLLWVTAGGTPGAVSEIAPRLLRGHLSRFMRHDVSDDFSVPEWRELMRNAWVLRQSVSALAAPRLDELGPVRQLISRFRYTRNALDGSISRTTADSPC